MMPASKDTVIVQYGHSCTSYGSVLHPHVLHDVGSEKSNLAPSGESYGYHDP